MNNFRFDKEYLFITGVIRSYETSFLPSEIINKLIISDSIETAITILEGTTYRDFMNSNDHLDFEKMIKNRKRWLFSFVEEYSYFQEIAILLRLEYDYHNIKTLLKEKIFNLPYIDAVVDMGTIDRNKIREIIINEKYSNLPEQMQKRVKSAIENYYKEKKPLLIDLIIDQGLFEDLLLRLNKLPGNFITEYYRLKIDIINISTFFRTIDQNISPLIKELIFIEGGNIEISILHKLHIQSVELIGKYLENKEMTEISRVLLEYKNDPSIIEKAGDTILYNYLKKANYIISGVEPLFAFSQILLMELKTTGIILNAKKAGFNPEWIRKKITDLN